MNSNKKILYLPQYLSGAPKRIVEGYQFLKTADAYSKAKKTLQKRFGHPSVVAEAFCKRLENWPKIHPKDGFALREFADFLKTCELAMQSEEDLETLNTQHDNKQLFKVLPNWAHPKWGVRVRDYQTKHGDNKFPHSWNLLNLSLRLLRCNACLFLLTWTQAFQQEKTRTEASGEEMEVVGTRKQIP